MHQRFRIALSTAVAATLTGGLLATAGGTASAAAVGPKTDFNGDGFPDLAVSAPLTTVNGRSSAGTVAVVFGSASGLDKAKRQVISQDTAGIPGTAESGDNFGEHLTTGDLDGDGYTDLVVGVPRERIGSTDDFGTVSILWGSAQGLTSGKDLAGPMPEFHYEFGLDVAAGDFDGNGKTDLAVIANNGDAPFVFQGPFTRTGLAAGRTDMAIPSTVVQAESLEAGNVTGDAATDLVVLGTKDDGVNFPASAVLYKGSASGLTKAGTVAGGYSAAVADVNKDGFGDIVTGAAYEKSAWLPAGALGGAITVTYGSATGLSSTKAPVKITQDSAGVPGAGEVNDRFGTAVSTGDVNGDGYADVAVGVEGEDLNGVKNAGATVVLRGASSGLSGTGAVAYNQETSGIPGGSETADQFGGGVQLIDANASGRSELAVGAFAENDGAGMVWYLKSASTGGLTTTGTTYFGQTALGGPGGLSYFGWSFAR